jgi:hypothetical protein
MKKGCTIAILTILGIGIILISLVYWALQPEFKTVEINQNIGGKLVCKMEYYPDLHSWEYIINYEYKFKNGKTLNLGQGIYSGREWNEDEQLVKVNNLYVLKTGNFHGSDKIIYGDFKSKKWKEYEFTSKGIENDSLWKTKNIKSLNNYWPHRTFVSNITNDQILVIYEYRIDPNNADLTEKKIIEYELIEKPVIKKITNYNTVYN